MDKNKENKQSPRVVTEQDHHVQLNERNRKRGLEPGPSNSNEQSGDQNLQGEQQRSNQTPKRERLDNDIEEMAKKMRIDNQRKLEHLKTLATLNNVPRPSSSNPTTASKPDDWASIQGQFGWAEVGPTMIPYLTRRGKLLISMRMADNRIFYKYNNLFSEEVRRCFRTHVKVFNATTAEAHLLNEINVKHCDNFYGKVEFGVGDSMNLLADVKEMYEFLELCYVLLIERMPASQNRCGYIKIADQNCVPYVWYEGRQYVPLLYFEGECKYLEERTVPLSGWILAYIKLLCKIQGIRRNLYDVYSLSMVDVDLVKRFFPPDTPFGVCWPLDYRYDSLITRPVPKLVFSQDVTRSVASSSNVQANNVNQNPANLATPVTHHQQVYLAPKTNNLIPTMPPGQNNFRMPPPVYTYMSTAPTTITSQVYNTVGSVQSSSVVQRSRAPTQTSSRPPGANSTVVQKTFVTTVANCTQNNTSQVYGGGSGSSYVFQRIRAPAWPSGPVSTVVQNTFVTTGPNYAQNNTPHVYSVPGCSSGAQTSRAPAGPSAPISTGVQKTFVASGANHVQNNMGYKVQPMANVYGSRTMQIPNMKAVSGYGLVPYPVEQKTLQYCINLEPYTNSTLLVTFEEVSAFFELPLNMVIKAINVMKLDTFLPNKKQMKQFQKSNIQSTRGLIRVSDFVDNLPRLRYILSKTTNFDD